MAKNIYLLLVVILLMASCSYDGKYKVSGEIYRHVHEGNGGAARAGVSYVSKDNPVANSVYLVFEGNEYKGENEIVRFTTDSKGKYSFRVEPGEYCIMGESYLEVKNYDFNRYTSIEEQNRCDFTVEVVNENVKQGRSFIGRRESIPIP